MDAKKKSHWIKVWDLPTRLFHWTLVTTVTTALITGFIAPEWWMGLHAAAGYLLVVLIVFRIVWGIYGSEYSRIASFAYPPRQVADYLKGVLMLRPEHHIGHNPAGAMMIFALMAALTLLTVTGLMVLGGEEGQGPLQSVVTYKTGSAAKDVHSILSYLLLLMIGGHLAGVLVESLLMKDNLVRAMITGKKRIADDEPHPAHRDARPKKAAAVIAAVVVLAGAGLVAASALPPKGLRPLAENATFKKECGDCHTAFHPSLLPAESWKRVMADLSDHFGEDATLGEPKLTEVADYLVANGAETWDTEASNRFRRISAAEPRRITATRYWKRKHKEITPAVFAQKTVGGKANCSACHLDAASGRFDDQAIKIPKEEVK